MSQSPFVPRINRGRINYRIVAGGVLLFAIAVGAIAYGVMAGDTVTAFGAVLLLPAAALLAAIGLSPDNDTDRETTP